MSLQSNDDPADTIDQLRARANEAERLAAVRDASLKEIAKYARDLHCQIADLADDAHTLFKTKPYPAEGLRYVTERMNRLADTLTRTAIGYANARTEDMPYPNILDELAAHGWIARPDRELDGTLPPLHPAELGDARGYRRGFARGARTLTLWFTRPDCVAYAHSGTRGRLHTAAEVRAVISGRSDFDS
ncbi:hypothetical protein DMP23_21240 [Amycolatopsis sp. A1MSW2902]|uniref:hypothetical protein n=1 Tax=Amycolatopsis sp. A1MSW2902 TaxID=687413 RepID=UPI00307EEC98